MCTCSLPWADRVKELKRGSTAGLRGQAAALAGFEWQAGYGAFLVRASRLDGVIACIAHQEAHHQAVGFEDELRAFFRKNKVAFDERYVWD